MRVLARLPRLSIEHCAPILAVGGAVLESAQLTAMPSYGLGRFQSVSIGVSVPLALTAKASRAPAPPLSTYRNCPSGDAAESVVPACAVAALAFNRAGTPVAPSLKELTVPLPAFDPKKYPCALEIQHSAAHRRDRPDRRQRSVGLDRVRAHEAVPASTATSRPCASNVKAKGTGLVGGVTVA